MKKGIPEFNFKLNTCHDKMLKELLQIILPVISFYDPQVGQYTTNGSSIYVFYYNL